MAINSNDLVQPMRGTIFYADSDTALPDDIGQFKLNAATAGSWTNIGHTSNSNKIEFSSDGGEATTIDSWLQSGVRTTYSTVTGTVTGKSIQGDAETLKLIYNAVDTSDGGVAFGLDKHERKLALFILIQDPGSNQRVGIYMPNTSFAYDGLPDMTGGDDSFTEYGFTASILSSTVLPADESGKPTAIAIYSPETFGSIVPVTGVTVDESEFSVQAGSTHQIHASVQPSGASQALTYKSADDTKVTVTDTGLVTGKAATDSGTPVAITVASVADPSKKATVNVIVTPKA